MVSEFSENCWFIEWPYDCSGHKTKNEQRPPISQEAMDIIFDLKYKSLESTFIRHKSFALNSRRNSQSALSHEWRALSCTPACHPIESDGTSE